VIPVLIAPVYNRHDLLERMLRSVTHPVERGLIIDNGMTGYVKPDWIGPEWQVTAPAYTSYGYPGSINLGIMQTPDAPWWLWVSNDVVFGEGDLDAFAARMDTDEPRIVTYHFAMGVLNRALVQEVGLFDEWSFWPLYYDDNDYAWRCHLAGFDVEYYDGAMTEGADGHQTSLTILSDPTIAAANAVTWDINKRAYIAKWGGPPGKEKLKTPWGQRLPLWATRPDPAGRARRLW
jgi:GT2 family glycosyltransferase